MKRVDNALAKAKSTLNDSTVVEREAEMVSDRGRHLTTEPSYIQPIKHFLINLVS